MAAEADVFVQHVTAALRAGLKNDIAVPMPFQLEVIKSLLELKKDVLYIDRTGAGKSETYFVAAKLLRSANPRAGPVIVVTPLVALIHDQVRRAKAFGLHAAGYYGEDKGMTKLMQGAVTDELEGNTLDLLFLTAEMLERLTRDSDVYKGYTYTHKILKASPAMKRHPPDLSNCKWDHVPLLVVDEIHYIAEAGHDFRLDYSEVWGKLANHAWFQRVRKLGLTATVTQRIRSSLVQAWPAVADWKTVLGQLYRDNIKIRVQAKPVNEAARVDYIRQLFLKDTSVNILVFCKSIVDIKTFSKDLQTALASNGIPAAKVAFYSSPNKDMPAADVKAVKLNEAAFRKGTVQILFSTCALGLGYDKSDIHHVVHLWTPNSIVQYYQEFGRAGRSQAGILATAHLLPTSPWNPTGWVAVLSSICWYLVRQPNNIATEDDIKQFADSKKHKASDVTRALELGEKKGMFQLRRIGDTDQREVHFLKALENIQQIDKLYSEHMEEDVNVMGKLSANGGEDPLCLWNFIIANFECQKNNALMCMKCSGLLCQPGGDIAPNSQAAGIRFYQVITPVNQVTVFALNKKGEELRSSEQRIKDIFTMHRSSMVLEPPGKWTICPLPNATGSNARDAELLAEWLNDMEVKEFIHKNPDEERKVTGAPSREARLDILRNKFIYNWDEMPTVGNMLLYDDVVSSGDTIDAVVTAVRQRLNGRPMEITVLTQFVYTGSKVTSPAVSRLTAASLKAEEEQPAQA